MENRVLTVSDLHLSRGSRQILRGVSLTVARGECVAIMGPSGSGKTTVLRAIAGLETVDRGQIDVDGQVGMVFQFHCLFEHLTALQNVCLAPVYARGVSRDAASRRGRELLSAFGVEHRAHALPRHLSGGEAQRVAIARALAVDPPVLLMDEPTASLDAVRRAELRELLAELRRRETGLLLATHDEEFASACATRVLQMQDGVVATR
jgi:ABC-type polar amino acid transport system ATPase subunit